MASWRFARFCHWLQPIGQRVRVSKKPYSAFFLGLAGQGSWSQFKTNVAIFWCWAQRQLRHIQSKTQTTVQATRASLQTHWNRLVGLIRNLWKDSEKSMRSSKPGPYYFKHKKKHLESPLSAWFYWVICGGRYKFRTCDPCSVKTPEFHHFPI